MGRVHVYDTSLSWREFMTIATSKDLRPYFYLYVKSFNFFLFFLKENKIFDLKFYFQIYIRSRSFLCFFAKLIYVFQNL